MASTIEVVESYRSALGRGDFGAARALMQDDMTFQGPLDTFNTAELCSMRALSRPYSEGEDSW